MKASESGWCEGRRLGASSIFAGESLHEYPTAEADRAGITAFRGSTFFPPALLLNCVDYEAVGAVKSFGLSFRHFFARTPLHPG